MLSEVYSIRQFVLTCGQQHQHQYRRPRQVRLDHALGVRKRSSLRPSRARNQNTPFSTSRVGAAAAAKAERRRALGDRLTITES